MCAIQGAREGHEDGRKAGGELIEKSRRRKRMMRKSREDEEEE